MNDRGEVDFSALARDRADLETYVIHVAGTPFGDFPAGHERLAHYINAYNALSMYNVLDSGNERDVQRNITAPDYGAFYNPIQRSIGFVVGTTRP